MTHTSAVIRSMRSSLLRSRSVPELLEQLDELRTRVRTVRGDHDAAYPARRALDAEHDHLVARIGVALEPERAPDEQLGWCVADVARDAADGSVGEREVAPVAVGLEQRDRLGHRRRRFHTRTLGRAPRVG